MRDCYSPDLAPPLRMGWSLRGGLGVFAESGDVACVGLQNGLAAVTRTGRVAWKSRGLFLSAHALPGGDVIVYRDRRGSLLLDLQSGEEKWAAGARGDVRLVEGDICVVTKERPSGESSLSVTFPPPSFEPQWERTFPSPDGKRSITGEIAAQNGLLFLLAHGRPNGPHVLAVGARNGEETWATSLAELGVRAPSYWQCWTSIDGLFAFKTDRGALVALEAGTGSLRWKTTTPGKVAASRHLVVAAEPTRIRVLDGVSGAVVRQADVRKLLAGRHALNVLSSSPIVSDTHVFVGDAMGTLWAFDLTTCQPVWDSRPPETHGNPRYMTTFGQRLYMGDYSDDWKDVRHLFCWEPLVSGEAEPPKVPLATFEFEGELPFSVEEVAERRRLTRRVPYHEKGGTWTVYRCRLGQATFYVADRVSSKAGPVRGAVAALWVASATDGDSLLRAFRKAMPDRRARVRGAALRVKPPTLLAAIDLASEGHKQRRKWLAADGSELLVYWNAKTKEGKFMEKDPVNRRAFLETIAGLVAR